MQGTLTYNNLDFAGTFLKLPKVGELFTIFGTPLVGGNYTAMRLGEVEEVKIVSFETIKFRTALGNSYVLKVKEDKKC